jgi:hypothetical protein
VEFLLFVCNDPTAPPYVAAEDNIEQWVTDLEKRGAHTGGNRVRPASDAVTVAVRDGETRVSAGQFAESADWLAGFDTIDCADLDEAVLIASKHPMARFGSIEIRPIWPFE